MIYKLVELQDQFGDVVMVFGDCNEMHEVTQIGGAIIEDLDEYFLEEIHPNDNENNLPVNAIVIC
ncbi:hypothetical protein D3C86_1844230 [compost metagenome]